jgi:signal transduction histidine kinase
LYSLRADPKIERSESQGVDSAQAIVQPAARGGLCVKISTKITAGTVLLSAMVLGVGALWLLKAETLAWQAVTTREVLEMGRMLQISIRASWRDGQGADIRDLVAQLEIDAPELDIAVYDAEWEPLRPHMPPADDELRGCMADLKDEPRWLRDDDEARVVALPMHGEDGEFLGAVRLSRLMEDVERDLNATRRRLVVLVLAFVVLSLASGLVLGQLWLRKPLAAMNRSLSGIDLHTLSGSLPTDRPDELGELARAFERQLAQLREAQAQARHQELRHRQLLQTLQHADKLATIGQMVAQVAHEVGTPLQIIEGRAAALSEASEDPLVQRHAAQILAQSERLTRLIRQLMHHARRPSAERTLVDVAKVARQLVELIEGAARRRGFEMGLAVKACAPIKASADQVEQVVLNLVTNAMRVTKAGGAVRVLVEPEQREGRAGVAFIVEDTGPGIPDEVQPRLFEPFFTTEASVGGLGLGLPIVREILIEHGGQIALSNRDGGGCRAWTWWPVADRAEL